MSPLQKRCLEISYRHKLSHLSSVLGCVNIIDDIYANKQPEDVFVLGNSHAALALFVVLEKHLGLDAEELFDRHGTHACRNPLDGVWVSGGSLGQPETVAVGLAMANPKRNVYLLTSDGACAEGAFAEAMAVASDKKLCNLYVTVACNGHSAYRELKPSEWHVAVKFVNTDEPEQFRGIQGHYAILNLPKYQELIDA